MNIEQVMAGIAYFERLFSLSSIGQDNVNFTGSERRIITCPITNRRLANENSVRQLSVPFIVAVRNYLLIRAWDFFRQENFREILNRFNALVVRSEMEVINGMSSSSAVEENWVQGHQILAALQEQNNAVVQEYQQRPTLLSMYSRWQLSVLTGNNESTEFNFDITSNEAQNDLHYVNQNGLQNASLAVVLGRLDVAFQSLIDSDSTTQEPPFMPILMRSHTRQPSAESTEQDREIISAEQWADFFTQTDNNPVENNTHSVNESTWGDWTTASQMNNTVQNARTTLVSEELTDPLLFSCPITTSIPTPSQQMICADDDANEEKEEPPISPIERREIIVPNSNNFVYQGQPRLTNLPLVGAYLSTLALPTVPIIHPYHPNTNARPDVFNESFIQHGNVRVSVAVQLPQEGAYLPVGVLERLAEQGFQRENLEIFICIQDNPWENNAERLLRIHPYVHPFTADNGAVDVDNTVQVSIAELGKRFSAFSQYLVRTHQGVFSPRNMQVIGELNFETTHSLYSLCTNPRTNKIGLTLHILLSDANQRVILELLKNENINSLDTFINASEIINTIAEAGDYFPIMELRHLAGIEPRPAIDNHSLLESQIQLAIEVRRVLPTAIRLASERTRLSQEFSGQHSAGGGNLRLERAGNRAGLNFVRSVLGREFGIDCLSTNEVQRLNAIIQDFVNSLREGLSASLRKNEYLLGSLDPAHYNNIQHPHVYFHPYAVTMRAVLHNQKIRHEYRNGILIKEIAAIWYSIRNLPPEDRENYMNNFSIQMHEIQRAYNIARFYQRFFYSDNRTPQDWLSSEQGFHINNAKAVWSRVEENIDIVFNAFVNRPSRAMPDESIPDEDLSTDQKNLRRLHSEANQRMAAFERVRNFILNTTTNNRNGTIDITHEIAGIEVGMGEGGSNRSLLENFVKIIEIMNKLDYPTIAIATDNLDRDAESCSQGTEIRIMDYAHTIPKVVVISISPLQATRLFQEFIVARLPKWVDRGIMTFEAINKEIHDELNEMAQNSPEIKVALSVRNNLTEELILDEVIKCILDDICISHSEEINQTNLEPEPEEQKSQSDAYGELQTNYEEEIAVPELETETQAEEPRSPRYYRRH